MKVGIKRPSPAIVIAVIALIVTLTGTAYAALAPHSVGSRQLKPRAVTAAKLADGAVTTNKVAKTTLTGRNFKVSEFSTLPSAQSAKSASNSITVNGHQASCPGNTILIRGSCYDPAPSGPVLGVRAAADACAARGGFLPTPGEALTIRGTVPLGDGTGTNSVFTDTYVANTQGVQFWTTVVNNSGAVPVRDEDEKIKDKVIANYNYVCVYELVH
jgi:hypothetical protein